MLEGGVTMSPSRLARNWEACLPKRRTTLTTTSADVLARYVGEPPVPP